MKRLFLIIAMALFTGTNLFAKDKKVVLRIVETSDVHGAFFPYDFITREPRAGSIARISTYVNKLRKKYGDNLLLFENGDILQGQPTCYFYNYINTKEENIAASVVNYLRYDAQTFGNHDVETGHAVYDKWMKEVKCPVIGANIIDKSTGEPYVKPYIMLKRNGVRIAVIGLLTPAIPNWLTEDLWSGLRFDEMVSSARHWMKIVREKEKADVVIGLFHSGKDGGITTSKYEEDASERVAREVPGFDLVLFGHDHTRHNDRVVNTEGQEVLCLDPANNALSVAEATISITLHKGKVVAKRVSGTVADVSDEPIDDEYMAHFKPAIDKINDYVGRKIGTFTKTIYTRDSYFGSSAFSDFILNIQMKVAKAEIALNAPLQFDAKIKEGPVYVADMFNLYKYENQLYLMKLTGEEIRKHLEMSYNLWVNTMTSPDDHLLLMSEYTRGDQQRMGFKNFSFNFDSAAGIDYEVDVTKPEGQKVRILRMSNGEPFDESRWYLVAVNSYRGNGGGELLTKGAGIPRDSLDSRIIWRSERDFRYYLMEEIERMGTVDPKPNNNWRFIPTEWVEQAAQRDRELLFKHKKQ